MVDKISARDAAALLATLPTLPAPILVERLDDTGLVNTTTADAGMTLNCYTGQFSTPEDWVDIQFKNLSQPDSDWGILKAKAQLKAPEDAITSIFVAAQRGGFPHLNYLCRYAIYQDLGGVAGDLSEYSDSSPFIVDRYGPYRSVNDQNSRPPLKVLLPATLPSPITGTYIDNNPTIPGNVPPNNFTETVGQFADGDMIQLFLGPDMFNKDDKYKVGAPFLMMDAANTPFSLPTTAFTTDAIQYLYYILTDKSGNESLPAIAEPLRVSVLDPPGRGQIFIPLAPSPELGNTDDLLDNADYQAGIEARVRAYTNSQPTLDQNEIKWGSQPYSLLTPASAFDVVFKGAALNALIRAEYGVQVGPQPVTVFYRVVRGSEIFQSDPKVIKVDLSVPGPVNPGDPGTPNINLPPARFFGQGTPPSGQNILREVDANLRVNVEIDIPTTGAPPQTGYMINLVRPDGTIIQPPEPIGTLLPGDMLKFTIPWSDIVAGGNVKQPFHYNVTGPGTTNPNISPATEVDVIDAVSHTLPLPVFQRLTGGQVRCTSLVDIPGTTPLDHYVEVYVPGDPLMVSSRKLTLNARVVSPRTGLPTVTRLFDTYVEITDAIRLSGYTFRLPYRDLLIYLRIGTLEVTVTTTFADGAVARVTTSVVGRSVIVNSYCDKEIVTPTTP
ncbi:hypothetical protein [Pseudomonas sp. L1(2025)]|uniref:hypothetical protein n=1 Tax=Pseudomonas sp. L1(2025) TaxID=3449429 RepID=UPI003F693D0B